MREIGLNEDEVTIENYRTWPLFKVIRNEKKFLKTFESIFKEPFVKI
jgi:hypothetical protein